MKLILRILILGLIFGYHSQITAQSQQDTTKITPTQHGKNFVDKNGDGYNDNAPDHDGDGIPNGLDPDFTGPKHQYGKKAFIDLDGDGIDDNTGKVKGRKGKGGYGPNGMGGNQSGVNNGTNNSDGTGSQGTGSRGNRRGRK